MSNDPVEVQAWLRRLEWSLKSVRSSGRDDVVREIVEEARAHLGDAIAAGRSPAEALAGFGAPEDYAQQFVDEMDVYGALGSRRFGAMLSAVGRRVHNSAIAGVAGLILLVLGAVVFTALSLAVFKLSDPVHTGLWRNAHEFFIGKIDDPAEAAELLGNWLFVLAAMAVAIAWLCGRFVLFWTLRLLARSR